MGADFLTKQDVKFVETYIETGNATKSAKEAYDIESYSYAGVKGHENLKKPKIQDAIDDALLYKHHIDLFKSKRVDYFVFPKTMSDEAIVEHVNSTGIKVITVRETDKGKMAFYAVPDANAIKGALDLAYKIKGTYAPEKSVVLNIDAEADPVVEELTAKLNAYVYKGTGIESNGGESSSMGTEVQS